MTARPLQVTAPSLMAAATRARDVPAGRVAARNASSRCRLDGSTLYGMRTVKRCGRRELRASARGRGLDDARLRAACVKNWHRLRLLHRGAGDRRCAAAQQRGARSQNASRAHQNDKGGARQSRYTDNTNDRGYENHKKIAGVPPQKNFHTLQSAWGKTSPPPSRFTF